MAFENWFKLELGSGFSVSRNRLLETVFLLKHPPVGDGLVILLLRLAGRSLDPEPLVWGELVTGFSGSSGCRYGQLQPRISTVGGYFSLHTLLRMESGSF